MSIFYVGGRDRQRRAMIEDLYLDKLFKMALDIKHPWESWNLSFGFTSPIAMSKGGFME